MTPSIGKDSKGLDLDMLLGVLSGWSQSSTGRELRTGMCEAGSKPESDADENEGLVPQSNKPSGRPNYTTEMPLIINHTTDWVNDFQQVSEADGKPLP